MEGEAPEPLDVLLRAMRLRWWDGQVEEAMALAMAAAAALGQLGDDELDELSGTAGLRTGAAA